MTSQTEKQIMALVPEIVVGMPQAQALELILKELKRLNAEIKKLMAVH